MKHSKLFSKIILAPVALALSAFPQDAFADSPAGVGSIGDVSAALGNNPPRRESEKEKTEKLKEKIKEAFPPARAQVQAGTTVFKPFYAYYKQRLPASINKGGKMGASTYGTGISLMHVNGERSLITLANADYRRTNYRWSSIAEGPFDNTDSISSLFWQEWVFDTDSGRAIAGFASASAGADDGTSLSAGASGTFGLGGKQYFSKTESLWLGAIASYSRHRERWIATPMFFFDWIPAENINLRIANGITATWDVGGENEFLLSLGISYEANSIAIGKGDVWRCQSAPLVLTATWNVTENLSFSFGANTILWSDYRRWEGGHESDDHFTVDPSLEFFVQAGLRF